ncbi:MAG: ABC transporter permease [Methylococcaceae bacterium]|nr:ABC transporter permease [Methylococcaceae bacterium]
MPGAPTTDSLPSVTLASADEGGVVLLRGNWNLRGLAGSEARLLRELSVRGGDVELRWNLMEIETLDSAGAYLLWRTWGKRLPAKLTLRPDQQAILTRWQEPGTAGEGPPPIRVPVLQRLRGMFGAAADHVLGVTALVGRLAWDLVRLLRHPGQTPWREISATIHETGGRALGITALVGFLIGVVVSYLSSLQLQTLGAQIYIVNILGLSIIRELGPLLAAILVAGRSGSAMTARLGVMRVTQELDALSAMGISHSLRLVLPKVLALGIALPLLTVWTDLIALIGGAVSAYVELDIGIYQFILKLPGAVPVVNFAIGLGKGAVFGLLIGLIACHFGLRIRPDTESLGNETTNSVVASITVVILVDSLFAIMFRGVGLR